MGIIPIIVKRDFFSCANPKKPYKLGLYLIKYGGCSLMVERVVVASDFAKLPITLDFERGQEEFTDFVLCEITGKIRKTRVRFSPSALYVAKLQPVAIFQRSWMGSIQIKEEK